MRQIILLSLVTLSLIITGAATLNALLLALSLPFFLYLLVGFLFPSRQPDLAIDRYLSTERTAPGDQVTISLTITNRGPGVDALLVEDILPPKVTVIDGSPNHLLNLKANESFSWTYKIVSQRGYHSFNTVQVETRRPLGLSPQKQLFPASGSLLVHPRVLNLKRVAIRPHWTRVYAGEIPSRSGGQGTDFFGIRRYQPGDPPNWINWHASARHPSLLFSNEFEQDRVSDVGIILDGREKVNTISSQTDIFEYSIQAAATLAAAFIQQGDRVGLLNYGKFLEWTFPGYGKYQLERILRALSKAQPGQSLVFSFLEYIPTQIFPPKSQIVLISPIGPDDHDILLQIRARGYQLLVISPDPIAYEKSLLPPTPQTDLAARILHLERNLQIDKLLRGGIQVLDWKVDQPLELLVNRLQRTPPFFHPVEMSH